MTLEKYRNSSVLAICGLTLASNQAPRSLSLTPAMLGRRKESEK